MNAKWIILFIAIIGLSCNSDSSLNPRNALTIKSGTSFGFCFGYCKREIQISQTQVTYTMSSWRPEEYPTQTTTGTITENEWTRLLETIDTDQLQKMDDIYGCPDCADGGAEWIEVQGGTISKKITFNYGDSLSQVQNLIDQLRAIRQRFSEAN